MTLLPDYRHSMDPYHQFRQEERADWNELVPMLTLALYLCDGVRDRVRIEEIAEQINLTYPPRHFSTRVNGKKILDLSLIYLTLDEGKRRHWGYVAGSWLRGWRLTSSHPKSGVFRAVFY